MSNQLRAGLTHYLNAEQIYRLNNANIGIAGAGGLGSNAAMFLARSGIEKLIIIDNDIIEPSNLNRQHYWPAQVGQPKVEALATHLRQLNPQIKIKSICERIDDQNLPALLTLADIWVEALDDAETKKFFVESALTAGCRVTAASGIAGYGGTPMCKKRMGEKLVLVGDFQTDIKDAPPLAPKVAQAAALLADSVLEFILDNPE